MARPKSKTTEEMLENINNEINELEKKIKTAKATKNELEKKLKEEQNEKLLAAIASSGLSVDEVITMVSTRTNTEKEGKQIS